MAKAKICDICGAFYIKVDKPLTIDKKPVGMAIMGLNYESYSDVCSGCIEAIQRTIDNRAGLENLSKDKDGDQE